LYKMIANYPNTSDAASKIDTKLSDREKICPFLLRVFTAIGRHNYCRDYARNTLPPSEVQIYTWRDCTLGELSDLIREAIPETRQRGTRYDYAIAYPDYRGLMYRMRDIGSVTSGKPGEDDGKMLGDLEFEIGDYVDVAIYPPNYSRLPLSRNFAP
ncbi:Histone deacetylase complex subunit SAP18, partial [Trichinella papuae]